MNGLFAESAPHEHLFLPKGHPDLNPIESVWAYLKRQVAIAWVGNRVGAETFKSRILAAMEMVEPAHIARCCRHSMLFAYMYLDPAMDVFRAKLAAKAYTGHRVCHGKQILRLLVFEAAAAGAAAVVDT